MKNSSASLTEVVVTGRKSDKVSIKSRTGSAEIITRQVAKSGTNELKGSICNFWKSPQLTGLNVGSNKVPPQQLENKNRGVSVGRPIIKNKLFFFVSGERQREGTPSTGR